MHQPKTIIHMLVNRQSYPDGVIQMKIKKSVVPNFLIHFLWFFYCIHCVAGNRPDVLQRAVVEVWSNDKCQNSFHEQKKSHVIKRTQMCAGKFTGGIDSCWVSFYFEMCIVHCES